MTIARLVQAFRLPQTLWTIRRIVREDFQTAALDQNLRAFESFHRGLLDPRDVARPWRKVRLASIELRHVDGLPVAEMASMMNVAMEIEEPILEYSHQNGEGFRFLLPSLARYMGKNSDEAEYAARNHLPWCESPWCAEERRHANTFARIIERITKTSPPRGNPNRPMVVAASETDAIRLIVSREAAEWNSSSTYLVMTAHATGDLHQLIRNIARDEIKHLSVLSAAGLYLFGPRPWERFAKLIRQGLDEFNIHRRNRTAGSFMAANTITAIEVIACHLMSEYYVRKWLRTIPLRTLTAIFETTSGLAERVEQELSLDRRSGLLETAGNGRIRRDSLTRWKTRTRRLALARRSFEETHCAAVESLVSTKLDNFAGAGPPGSRAGKQARSRIRRLSSGALRQCLFDRLRDHQIRDVL